MLKILQGELSVNTFQQYNNSHVAYMLLLNDLQFCMSQDTA